MTATVELPQRSYQRLARRFHGTVVRPRHADYAVARRVWNGMIDRYPALIARCADADDVRAAIEFGTSNGLPLAVRGGGHSVAGFGTVDGGVVVDLSAMRAINVDEEHRTADVSAGARMADLDEASAAHGLATTGGVISTTGVAGLTLGGGIGWLMRRHGLTCDNLVEMEMVTVTGEGIVASEQINPELFWALRGGGGNFGVITRFRYRLHPISTVYGGMVVYELADAQQVVDAWRTWAATAPDEASTMAAFITAPPHEPFPLELHGRGVLAIVGCWCGDPAEGERVFAPLRVLARPRLDLLGRLPYTSLQGMLDAGAPAGLRNYWKSGFMRDLDETTTAALIDHAASAPSRLSQIHLSQLGGAVSRLPQSATAYPHREAAYALNVVATWSREREDPAEIRWARDALSAASPAISGVYVNFLGDAGRQSARAVYDAATYNRLATAKRAWDPANVFRLNHNIEPAAT